MIILVNNLFSTFDKFNKYFKSLYSNPLCKVKDPRESFNNIDPAKLALADKLVDDMIAYSNSLSIASFNIKGSPALEERKIKIDNDIKLKRDLERSYKLETNPKKKFVLLTKIRGLTYSILKQIGQYFPDFTKISGYSSTWLTFGTSFLGATIAINNYFDVQLDPKYETDANRQLRKIDDLSSLESALINLSKTQKCVDNADSGSVNDILNKMKNDKLNLFNVFNNKLMASANRKTDADFKRYTIELDNLINTFKNNLTTWTKQIEDLCNNKDECNGRYIRLFKNRPAVNCIVYRGGGYTPQTFTARPTLDPLNPQDDVIQDGRIGLSTFTTPLKGQKIDISKLEGDLYAVQDASNGHVSIRPGPVPASALTIVQLQQIKDWALTRNSQPIDFNIQNKIHTWTWVIGVKSYAGKN